MKLEEFPVEILSAIFDGYSSFLVVSLWKCGNRCLNGKFQRGGITSMEISTMDSNTTSRWPRCLKEFKLSRLIVKSPRQALCTPATLQQELRKLNPGLKELSVQAPHLLEAFFPTPKKASSSGSHEGHRRTKRPQHQDRRANDDNAGSHSGSDGEEGRIQRRRPQTAQAPQQAHYARRQPIDGSHSGSDGEDGLSQRRAPPQQGRVDRRQPIEGSLSGSEGDDGRRRQRRTPEQQSIPLPQGGHYARRQPTEGSLSGSDGEDDRRRQRRPPQQANAPQTGQYALRQPVDGSLSDSEGEGGRSRQRRSPQRQAPHGQRRQSVDGSLSDSEGDDGRRRQRRTPQQQAIPLPQGAHYARRQPTHAPLSEYDGAYDRYDRRPHTAAVPLGPGGHYVPQQVHHRVDSREASLSGSDGEDDASKRLKLEEEQESDDIHASQWDIDATWPHMERLEIQHIHTRSRGVGHRPPLSPRLFALLPRSLIHFELRAEHTRFDSPLHGHFDLLPPKLIALRISCVNGIEADGLALIPPSITDIGNSLNDEAKRKLFKDPSLLPNLVSFPDELEYDLIEDALEHRMTWPQNLKSLSFDRIMPEQIFENANPLPVQLEMLRLISSLSNDLSEAWIQKALPRSLTQLEVELINWKGVSSSMWPPTLKSLKISCDIGGRPYFHLLPRTLTRLEASTTHNYETHDFSVEPSRLLSFGQKALEQDKELWQSQKKRIRDSKIVNGDASAYIEAVESGLLLGLPLTLTTVIFFHSEEDEPMDYILPPQVRELTVNRPTLSSLETAEPNWSRTFELLPPHLTLLRLDALAPCISDWKDQSLDPKLTSLYRLKSLRTLYFRRVEYPPNIAYFPPTLRELHFQNVTDRNRGLKLIEGDWMSQLPPALTVLNLNDMSMEGHSFAQLPPKLTSFTGVAVQATLEQLLRCPKSISKINLRSFGAPRTKFLSSEQLRNISEAYHPISTIFGVPKESIKIEMNIEAPEDTFDVDPRTKRRLQGL